MEKEERDEFDISDSDDGGLAKKVEATSKVTAKKKAPPKKLAKMTDLFPAAAPAKAADKKVPGPSKAAAKRPKKSESETEKPAKKKAKVFESDSDSDFEPRPKSQRG